MERIGKYEIRERLGEGMTSIVYLAHDSFANRDVALKKLYNEALNDPARGQIYRRLMVTEASLAGKLNHPHIVQIYDAVLTDDESYIVMEYVPGGTLEPFCQPDNLLPYDRLVEIIFKCTRALDYAYHEGITHRDIKPANILLANRDYLGGDIKISDFGAALVATDTDRTQVSGVGSPAYMSPQQVREMPLDQRTDIYSLGVVMYQLLCGRLPFHASNNYSMIYQITSLEALPPSTYRPDVPPALEAIAARAMAKELDDRYPDWEAFSQDLMRAFRTAQQSGRQQQFADSEKFETLRALPFFGEFSDVQLWEVVRFSDWTEVMPGAVVMHDGDPGKNFCFLASGAVEICKNGRRLVTLRPGECFGEMAVIHAKPASRAADVIALTDARIITIRGDALNRASEGCQMRFYRAFLEVLADRLSAANMQLARV
jgi:serine/threonine protein kinase